MALKVPTSFFDRTVALLVSTHLCRPTMAPRQQGLSAFLKVSSTKKHQTHHESESRTSFKRQKCDLLARGRGASRFGTCPLCEANLPLHVLEVHAENCTETTEVQEYVEKNESRKRDKSAGPSKSLKGPTAKKAVVPQVTTKPMPTEETPQCKDSTTSSKQLTTIEQNDPASNNKAPLVPWWKRGKPDITRIENPILPSSVPIPGLYLFGDFITEEEEEIILAELDGTCPDYRHEFLPWKQAKFNGSNKGKRWGVHCNLRDRRVSAPEHPMPHFFHAVLEEKLKRVIPMAGCFPNEANAIDYRRKQGHWLQSHVDDRQLSKEPIANLSVAGDCYMTFRNERVQGEEKRVFLRRRTLQVLTGKARYEYAHGISNDDLLSDRRLSITMRQSPLTKNK